MAPKRSLDPLVAAAADHAVVEVGLGRVDRHDRHAVGVQLGAALAEQLLEVHVADVARVVVARDHDHALAVDAIQVLGAPARTRRGSPSLVRSPETTTTSGCSSLISTIARSSRLGHEVRRAAVRVRELGDREAVAHAGSRRSASARRSSLRGSPFARAARRAPPGSRARRRRRAPAGSTRPAVRRDPTAASVPASRAAGARPVIAPTKSLRDRASSSGRPSAAQLGQPAQHLDRLGRGLGDVDARGRTRSAPPPPRARRASAQRSASRSTTSATTSS